MSEAGFDAETGLVCLDRSGVLFAEQLEREIHWSMRWMVHLPILSHPSVSNLDRSFFNWLPG